MEEDLGLIFCVFWLTESTLLGFLFPHCSLGKRKQLTLLSYCIIFF
jgi:hypothetical protein